MKKTICTILEISKPSFYLWKNKKHKILIKLLEKVVADNYSQISEIIKQKYTMDISLVTIPKNNLSKILEITEKNVYRWIKKRPLLFVILEKVFNNYLNPSPEEFLNNLNNDIDRDFTLLKEDEFFAKMFELDLLRSVFKNVISTEHNKLTSFDKNELEKLSIMCEVLHDIFEKNEKSHKKNIIRLFLEKDKFDAFKLDEVFEISNILDSKNKQDIRLLVSDIFECEDTIEIVKNNIKRMSYIDINLLIYTFVFSMYHEKNLSFIYSQYFNFLNKIDEQTDTPFFTNKVIAVFMQFSEQK